MSKLPYKYRNFRTIEGKEKRKLTSATDVLQGLFQNGKSALSSHFLRWRMADEWSDVVGPTVAAQTEPINVYKGMLYVSVSHSVWMQQLQFTKKEIILQINRYYKRDWIYDIKFTLVRSSQKERQQNRAEMFSSRSNGSPSEGEDPQRGR